MARNPVFFSLVLATIGSPLAVSAQEAAGAAPAPAPVATAPTPAPAPAVSVSKGAAFELYGRVDLSVGREYDTGNKFMANGSGSRLGVKGTYDLEDLGVGGKALFNIESRFKADTGAMDNDKSFWNGRAVVGLAGAWGEVLMGREYSPAYNLSQSLSDAWGFDTVAGAGGEYAMLQNKLVKKRYDNSLSYNFSMNGFKLGLQTAENEGQKKRPASAGVGYQEGAVKVGLGWEQPGDSDDSRLVTLGGSYKIGDFKVLAGLGKGTDKNKDDFDSLQLGATWTLGKGEARFGVSQLENSTDSVKLSQQLALGYHHALNKMVTVYTDLARDNKRFTGDKEDLAFDAGVKVNF